MELRDLAYFETIAELCHVGQAAERLHVTQPALSKCVARLEKELGAALFVRSGRRLTLTPMGELLLDRSRRIRQVVDETGKELNDYATGSVGQVRAGSAATTAEHLLPKALEELFRQAPDVAVTLQIGMNDVLHDQLRAGQLDLVVGPLLNNEPELVSTPIATDEVVVVARADHPIFTDRSPLERLPGYRWILPAGSVATRQWLDLRLTELGLRPPVVQIETNSIANLPALIASSGLLSFVTRRNLGENRFGRELRPLEDPRLVMSRQFAVARRADGYLSPAATLLLRLLTTRGGELMAP